jgi:hypothetical protein
MTMQDVGVALVMDIFFSVALTIALRLDQPSVIFHLHRSEG